LYLWRYHIATLEIPTFKKKLENEIKILHLNESASFDKIDIVVAQDIKMQHSLWMTAANVITKRYLIFS
jgi:hypothetical protein